MEIELVKAYQRAMSIYVREQSKTYGLAVRGVSRGALDGFEEQVRAEEVALERYKRARHNFVRGTPDHKTTLQ